MEDETPQRGRWDLGREAGVCATLVVLVLCVFGQVPYFEFLLYDDGRMVYENPHVQGGLTWDGVAWAFTHPHFGIWMPLTSLSHLLDVELFGGWAGGHHLTNLVLHLANVLLVYLALFRLTGERGKSFLAAALFAVHPMRASAVAWVSSRKELTYAFFFLIALLAYARYARKPSVARYVPVAVAMAFGLLCKPMIVTLPFVLLLLDVWPLGRLGADGAPWRERWRPGFRLVAEKMPLIVLALLGGCIAVLSQRDVYALASLEESPLAARFGNAAVSYVRYLAHSAAPYGLSAHYPHLGAGLTWEHILGAVLILGAVTGAVLALRRRPYLAAGWFWFLVTLVPVIGILQYGNASMADRYSYIPQIGLLLVAVWGGAALVSALRREPRETEAKQARSRKAAKKPGARRRAPMLPVRVEHLVISVVAVGVFAWLGHAETGYWRDTEGLFRRALAISDNNALAHTNLGNSLLQQGRLDEATTHFQAAVHIEPRNFLWHFNLGSALLMQGKNAEAAVALATAVKGNAEHAPTLTNLGLALTRLRRYDQACHFFERAIRIAPEAVNTRINYGRALVGRRQYRAALEQFEAALRLEPGNASAREGLEVAGKAAATSESRVTSDE